MKKVIFVTPNLTNGGAERVTAILANELAIQGFSVEIVFMKDSQTVYELNNFVKTFMFFSNGNRIYRIISKILKLRKLMKKNIDATFIAMLPFETFYIYLAGMGLHCKIVYSLRNDPANMNSLLEKYIKKRIYAKAYRIVFQTEQARNYFPQNIRKKGIIIPNPINDEIPERFIGKRRKEIVTVGRLKKQKNYPLLLRAFSNVYQKYPDWKLRIFGQGILEPELKQLCKDLGISKGVEFCGFVSNVTEKINQSGMFVLSSDYEGISNAMLEALATGLPCICTDCPAGGARMMIKDHENGILVPVRNEQKLSEAMLELIENPMLAERLSKNAVNIKHIWSVQKVSEEWRQVL